MPQDSLQWTEKCRGRRLQEELIGVCSSPLLRVLLQRLLPGCTPRSCTSGGPGMAEREQKLVFPGLLREGDGICMHEV